MTAAEVLERASAAGVDVVLEDGRPRLRGPAAAVDELLPDAQLVRDDIVRLLQGEATALPAPDPELLSVVLALGPLVGERDLELLTAQANPEGAAWAHECALRELLRGPDAAIGQLTDEEAVSAALALLAAIRASESLRRALGPVLPAMEGRYGRLEHRAQHARTVLHLIAAEFCQAVIAGERAAADPTLRARNHELGATA